MTAAQTLERKLHALVEKDVIRDVIYRYCRAVDRCDLVRPDGTRIDNKSNCRYIDLFERRSGEWKILFRAAVADTMYDETVVSYADPAALGPLLATAPRAAHGKGDPAFLRYDARALDKPDFAMTDFWDAVVGRRI